MQSPPVHEIEILRANIPAFCENYTTVGKEGRRIETRRFFYLRSNGNETLYILPI